MRGLGLLVFGLGRGRLDPDPVHRVHGLGPGERDGPRMSAEVEVYMPLPPRREPPISAAAIRGVGVFYPYTIRVVSICDQEGAQCALVVEVSAGADVHEGYGGWVKP